jgi:hypothetical protein
MITVTASALAIAAVVVLATQERAGPPDQQLAGQSLARVADLPAGWRRGSTRRFVYVCARWDDRATARVHRRFSSNAGVAPAFASVEVALFRSAPDAVRAMAAAGAELQCYAGKLRRSMRATRVEVFSYPLPVVGLQVQAHAFNVTGEMDMGSYLLGPGLNVIDVARIRSGRAIVSLTDIEPLEGAMNASEEATVLQRMISRLR